MPSRQLEMPWPLLASTMLLLSGCGGGGGDDGAPSNLATLAPTRPVEHTDMQIASAIYEGSARTPPGFYVETVPSGHAVVATTHVKNTDVDPAIDTGSAQFELCTNDWNEALAWSETSASNALEYSALVATNDDARYFEFDRVKAGTPSVYTQARVYKCSYLNRSAANLRTGSGAAGQLNIRPLNADELRRMSEYTWQFTRYNNFGNVVLKSAGTSGAAIEHTLHIATLIRGGMSTSCDRIDVVAWRHQVNVTTGAVSLDAQTLWSFGARESGGVTELCAS